MKSPAVFLFRVLIAASLSAATLPLGASVPSDLPDAQVISSNEPVGRWQEDHIVTPVNQILTPTGVQVELPGLRPQALALSPDGHLLVTAGKTPELIVINPVAGNILQRIPLPSDLADSAEAAVSSHLLDPDTDGQLSYTGLIFSPDGRRIYLSNVNGSIKVFAVGRDHAVTGLFSIVLPPANAPRREAEIPSGLALSKDGKRLYVALNLSNRLAELDSRTGRVLRTWDVGFAPYDVVLAGQKAYVSNWGGRRPEPDSTTGPAGRGTLVRVDPVRHIASEGSVSIVDLKKNRVVGDL